MRTTLAHIAVTLGAVAFAQDIRAQPLPVLKDINTGIYLQNEQPPAFLNGFWYLRGFSEATGWEIYRTDGTASGTSLVVDAFTGPEDGGVYPPAVAGNRVFFAADSIEQLASLWMTDGTPGNAIRIVDTNGYSPMAAYGFAALGPYVYFFASTPDAGYELMRTDGTPGGTIVVKDINPGSAGTYASQLVAMGSMLLFTASGPGIGWGLWRTDGTEAGTQLVKEYQPLPVNTPPGGLTSVGDRVLFSSSDMLWASDGTTNGTIPLTTAVPRSPTFKAGPRLFYSYAGPATGTQLWVTDGTPVGTLFLKEISPDPSFLLEADVVGDSLLFSADIAPFGKRLWSSDGTPAGTTMVSDVPIGSNATLDAPAIVSLGSIATFFATDAQHGTELWRTDLTSAGTFLLKDILPGSGSGGGYGYAAGTRRLFTPRDSTGIGVWQSDGSVAGTTKLLDLGNYGEFAATRFTSPIALGNGAAFLLAKQNSIEDHSSGSTTWLTDFTANGTQPLSMPPGQPNGGSRCANDASRTAAGVVIFAASDPLHGCELWRSDGTAAGTFLAKDIEPGFGGSNPRKFVPAGAYVYFSAYDNNHGPELWRTDGTAAGTILIRHLNTGAAPDYPAYFASSPDYLYFSEEFASLYRVGPSGVAERNPHVPAGSIFDLAAMGGVVYLSFTTTVGGSELWRTDWTFGGTYVVKDIRPGPDAVGNLKFTVAGSQLFFSANDGTNGNELWRTDGTSQGTYMVQDITAGPASTNLYRGGVAGLQAFFITSAGALWTSNGAPGGAVLLHASADLYSPYAAADDLFYFVSVATPFTPELWRSDGTVAGTYAVRDAASAPIGGAILSMSAHGTNLYFSRQAAAGQSLTLWRTSGTQATTVKIADMPASEFSMQPYDSSLKPLLQAHPLGIFAHAMHPTMGQEPSFIALSPGHDPASDPDADGIPNFAEVSEGRNPFAKDNDVFGNARLFAMQQYRDFLAREGESAGIDYWVNQVSTGVGRGNVIESFFNSPEFQGVGSPVARLYFGFFLRIPDYAGLLFQMNALRTGTPLAVIANNFALSPEFTAIYGALDGAQYVALLYQNMFGRTATQGEIDYHVARLTGGATRGEVAAGFTESPEFVARVANDVYVTMMYVGMLRRSPEQGGFDFWVGYMDAGNPGLALIYGFLNSSEYHNRFLP